MVGKMSEFAGRRCHGLKTNTPFPNKVSICSSIAPDHCGANSDFIADSKPFGAVARYLLCAGVTDTAAATVCRLADAGAHR